MARPGGLVIAIDGPGAAGKGTAARGVARALGYQYVDTGAMYRAVALLASRRGLAWSDAPRVAALARSMAFRFAWDGEELRLFVGNDDVSDDIRTAEIGRGASDVSAHPEVRAALLEQQRALGASGGVVMDGRDIGTVIFPDADLKIFLVADLEERARRRTRELQQRDPSADLEAVRRGLAERDRQDSERATAPLVRAEDAVLVDTTALDIPGVIRVVLDEARRRLPG